MSILHNNCELFQNNINCKKVTLLMQQIVSRDDTTLLKEMWHSHNVLMKHDFY